MEKDKEQHLIYIVSHVLAGAEKKYEMLEKMVYVVLIVARKLKP